MKLEKWSDISGKFSHSLLLGNGASISIHPELSYTSLFTKVHGKLDKRLLDLFNNLHTTNFEFILRQLLETHQTNVVLSIKENVTEDLYKQLRSSLIEVIRSVHPEYQSVEKQLLQAGKFLQHFKWVISLNYDLLVYWAMIKTNEKEGQWFKDCFTNGVFEKDFKFLEKPFGNAKGATLVFYPHGSLYLATEPFGGEVKVTRSGGNHLRDTILKAWEQQNYLPLFVSEGRSTEKYQAITRNNYLNTVYDSVLAKVDTSLCIYGWSLGDQDQHILDALDRGNIKDIAISVYTKADKWEAQCAEISKKIANTHRIKNCNIHFFDAESNGCWIY